MSTEARRQALRHEDLAARSAAQSEFTRPVIIEAGAGTGKTSILVARIVCWCLGPGWEQARELCPDDASSDDRARELTRRVVAITFTEAAAAEMAERVGQALTAIVRGEIPVGVDPEVLPSDDQRKARAQAVLDAMFRLRVRTIHSFCQSLLQAYPIEAGLDPGFTIDADGHEIEQIVNDEVAAAARQALLDNPDRRWIELAGEGFALPELADTVREFVAEGITPSELRHDPFPREKIRQLRTLLLSELEAFFADERGCLDRASRARSLIKHRASLNDLRSILAANDDPALEHLIAAVTRIPKTALGKLRKWSRGSLDTKDERTILADVGPTFAESCRDLHARLAEIARLNPRATRLAAAISAELLETVLQELTRRGIATFHDLLSRTEALLRSHAWVAREIASDISQLLVDEFQDTDRLQCEIVRHLTLDASRGERTGLFIVGDPKQSIYGWRNADLAAYEAFTTAVVRAGGALFRLSVNYRSAPPILDEVERVIAPVMNEESGVQPPFEPLLACPEREDDPGMDREPWTPVEYWVSWPLDEDAAAPSADCLVGKANQAEAEAVARDMIELHQKAQVSWRKMAILIRSTGDLDTVLGELRRAGVPYAVARDREYFKRREIVEAAALLRVIIDPSDQLALMTVLRSDVVGVPDAALIPLWGEGFATLMCELGAGNHDCSTRIAEGIDTAAATIPGWVPGLDELANWPLNLKAAVLTIETLRLSFNNDAPDIFMEKLRTLWLAEATAATRYLGHYRRSRLHQFYRELENLLVHEALNRSEISRFLRRAIESGQESREPAPLDSVGDAVQVMTMHGAKGLDFDHVYLLQLHKSSGGPVSTPAAQVLRHGAASAYAILGWPTTTFLEHRRWADRVEEAERVRLLYVAMTRARHRLVLAGKWPETTPDHDQPQQRLLDLVMHRGVAERLLAQASDGVARRLDDTIQWVMPALAYPSPLVFSETRTAPVVNTKTIKQHAARLEQDRVRARAIMSLPFASRASSLAHHARAEAEETTPASADGEPVVASTVGTLVHRILEHLDFEGNLPEQLEDARSRSLLELERDLEPLLAEAGRKRLDGLLSIMLDGHILTRLTALSEHIVGREVPVLAGPVDATGFTSGMADLVYRDPNDSTLVIADYKTDVVGTDQINARAAAYRPQLEFYRSAFEEALKEPVLAEIWFIHADTVVRLDS